MSTFNLGLNSGTYFGTGYQASNAGGSYGNRTATASNINRISRDVASGQNSSIQAIDYYLQQGKVEQALELYEELMKNVEDTTSNGNYGYSLNNGQISSISNQAFAQYANGQTMLDAAMENTHSPFVTGLLEGIPVIGLFNKSNSDAETLSKITGTKTSFMDKIKEGAGAAVTGAGVGAACGATFLGVGAVPGAIVGAIVGAGQAIVKDLLGF